jgi:hypothetical protein
MRSKIELAREVWLLYKRSQDLQEAILGMFGEDFAHVVNEEELDREMKELPF